MRRLALVSLAMLVVMLGARFAAAQGAPAPAPMDPYAEPSEGEGEGDGTIVDDDLAPADEGPDAAQPFEATLAPYGDWAQDETYGEVWTPSESVVGPDFTPYATSGYWDNTEYGWTWISDFDWGWAPFHYGRWARLPTHRWCWVPGRTWGPGWVSWRSGGGFVGWAALPPRAFIRDHRHANVPGWRFATSASLGSRMRYLPNGQVRSVLGYTSPVRNDRTMTFGHSVVRYDGGPVASRAPARLAEVAPHMMPRFTPSRGYAAPTRTYAAPTRTFGPTRTYAAPAARQYYPTARPYVGVRAGGPVYRGPVMHAPTVRSAPMPSGPSFHGGGGGGGAHVGGGGHMGGGGHGRR